MASQKSRSSLNIRNARISDIPAIIALVDKVYPQLDSYSTAMVQGQISNFPEGQVVVEYDGDIVGYAASFIIDEAAALAVWHGGLCRPGAAAPAHRPAAL